MAGLQNRFLQKQVKKKKKISAAQRGSKHDNMMNATKHRAGKKHIGQGVN